MGTNEQSATFYQLHLVEGEGGLDPLDDNVDVEVRFSNGTRYTATFFTLENIRRLLHRYEKSGECCQGLYFWAADIIIVRDLRRESLEETIDDLIATGEFYSVFSGPFTD